MVGGFGPFSRSTSRPRHDMSHQLEHAFESNETNYESGYLRTNRKQTGVLNKVQTRRFVNLFQDTSRHSSLMKENFHKGT